MKGVAIPRPDVTCPHCERHFRSPVAEWRNGRVPFCSWACRVGHARRPEVVEARFWTHVRKGPGCWEWQGAKTRGGYGHLAVSGETVRNIRASRLSYELRYGPIAGGLHVLHRCDNPGCVRPDHLFLGTEDENRKDKVAKGRCPCGERHPGAKLTNAQARQIRERYFLCSATTKELAAEYGVDPYAIRSIIKGKSYREASLEGLMSLQQALAEVVQKRAGKAG